MQTTLAPIGAIHTAATDDAIPRHWSISTIEGYIELDARYRDGLADISVGDRVTVLFLFHRSPSFTDRMIKQTPPNQQRPKGIFSICSPIRPNPVGLSVFIVTSVHDTRIGITGIDTYDGTPVIDIKPHVEHVVE